ncbi:MAG: hypothetical protein IIW63_00525 [Clostridia bacterium]|nr:hypothetical protein [Clostridia bacterium]
MKKALSIMLTMCMVLSLFATFVVSASADNVVTWKDGQINDPADENPDDGQNLKFDNAYGYTFAIEADKKIGGEDNALIETVDEYKACNPNWAISVLLKPAGDLYEVVTVVVTPGSADKGIEKGIVIENGNIVLVAHSAYSYAHEKGLNFEGKLCALALKVGDKVKVADDKSSVYVLIPGVDDKEESVLVKGDNIAGDYTITDQFRQGGADAGWGWDPNAPIAYPDEGGSLTDGKVDTDATENVYADPVWAGFSYLVPTYKDVGYHAITLDLGEAKDLYEVAIYLGTTKLTSGIGCTNSTVQFFASNDGENWEAISDELVPVDDATVNVVRVASKVSANAKYVQVRFARDGWLFVSEVEVFEAVPASADVEFETITVDGVVTDNGWAADKWTAVSSENGFWQQQYEFETGAKVCPEFGYKYQFRTDDTKLYAAVVIDGDIVNGGNGNGTFVRLWLRDNDDATVYTSFYDFGFAEGEITTAAKYNTSTTENKGAAIEGSTVVAKASVVDGKTVIEFSIDVAEFCADGTFDYYICASQKVGENFGTLYFPAAPIGPTDANGGEGHKPHANLPWLSWHAATDATVDVADLALGVVENGETGDDLGDAGIYAIAALAVVALIGTAVVIKKRA